LRFYDANGTLSFGSSVTASGHNFAGKTVTWALDEIVNTEGDMAAPGAPEQGTFDVPLTATDVWGHVKVDCSQGVISVGVAPMPIAPTIAGTDPRGGGAGGNPCPAVAESFGSMGAPKAPAQGGASESWGWSVTKSPGAGTYSLQVLVRTLIETGVA
jgi:hypothetical protein